MEPVIGLDFGTTNSAIAVAADDRQATLASFADAAATTTSFRSILNFPAKDRSSPKKNETHAKPKTIKTKHKTKTKKQHNNTNKTNQASRLFTSTSINGRHYTLE